MQAHLPATYAAGAWASSRACLSTRQGRCPCQTCSSPRWAPRSGASTCRCVVWALWAALRMLGCSSGLEGSSGTNSKQAILSSLLLLTW